MAPTNKQCAVCSEPGKLCGSCENIHYCGPICQKADWKVHKLLCRSFKAARDPPGPDMMRVIAFPFHSAKPEFLWMPIRPGKFQRPIVGTYFDSNINLATDTHSFAIEPSTGKKLPLRVAIQTRDTASSDGSLLNRAIYHLTGGTTYQQFAGPVLAYGRGIEGEKDKHVNLDTTHLNVIKDWFTIGFHVNKNEKAYLERYDEETEMFGAGISKECADDFEKGLLANNETSPTFTPQDFNNPAFFEWYEKVEQFKQKWVAKKQAKEIALGIRSPGKFPDPIGEKELAWRNEMRVSGRKFNQEIMMHIIWESATKIWGGRGR